MFTKIGSHEVALQIEPYTAKENVQAVENISVYLFHYAAPKKVDGALWQKHEFKHIQDAVWNYGSE